MYGTKTDNWIGKPIVLFATKTDMKGERVDAIRIRFVQPPPPVNKPKRKPELEQSLAEELNDEIPF